MSIDEGKYNDMFTTQGKYYLKQKKLAWFIPQAITRDRVIIFATAVPAAAGY